MLRASGASEWYGPVEVEIPAVSAPLRWGEVAPNPSTGSVRMTLTGPSRAQVDVRVFDVAGHEVATVYQGALTSGAGTWTWNGGDDAGRTQPPGVYLLRAASARRSIVRRITLLR